MSKHIQRNSALLDVMELSRGGFSGMKGVVDFFVNEAPNVADLKALTATDIPMVASYTREAYLAVILLLSFDKNIYVNIVEDVVNIYSIGQDNYPQTLSKMQNLLANWKNRTCTMPRLPTGGLAFYRERTENEVAVPTNGCHNGRKIREE